MSEFIREVTVRSYELDAFGHVNHAVYLNYLEVARFDALEQGGFPPSALAENEWAIHVVRVEVDYLKPCFQGQVLRITTRVEQFRRTSMILAQQIHRVADGEEAEPAVRARVTTVWIGEGGRPVRIPDWARAALGGGGSG
jgi:YbgC/YbaW family acyl-CoA thioester hydrolase